MNSTCPAILPGVRSGGARPVRIPNAPVAALAACIALLPTTASAAPTVPAGYTVLTRISGGAFAAKTLCGIAISSVDATVYVATRASNGFSDPFDLWRVTTAGVATQVGTGYVIGGSYNVDLEWGPDNQIYVGRGDGLIYKINPTTGATTTFSSTGLSLSQHSLEFDVGGNLIVMPENSTNSFYRAIPGSGNQFLGSYVQGTNEFDHGDHMGIAPNGDYIIYPDGGFTQFNPNSAVVCRLIVAGHDAGTNFTKVRMSSTDQGALGVNYVDSIGAIDPGTGDVFATTANVGQGSRVIVKTLSTGTASTPSSVFVDDIGTGTKSAQGESGTFGVTDLDFGLSTSGSGRSLYFLDNSSAKAVYEVSFGSQTVVTGATANVTFATADLAGTVNPEGLASTAHFEYGTSPAFGSVTPDQNVGSGSSAVPVTASLSGLQAGTIYYYRLVATNINGTSLGAPLTFRTIGAGDLDLTFNSTGKVTTAIGSGNEAAYGVAVQTDGKIVAAGYSFNGSGNDFAVIRYNNDGSLDTTFNGTGKVTTSIGTNAEGNSVALQTDGKIVVAGYATIGGVRNFAVVSYNTNGTLDTGFGTGGKVTTVLGGIDDTANSVVVQTDGKIVAAGYAIIAGTSQFAVARYNDNGTLDTGFNGTGKVSTPVGNGSQGHSVALQSDGRIVVAGEAYNGSNDDIAVVRYNTNGTLDTDFDSDGKVMTGIGSSGDEGYGVAVQSDGKIVVAGVTGNGSNDDIGVVRFDANGGLDTGFGTGGKVMTPIGNAGDAAFSVALESNGKIVVAGASSASTSDIAVARYNANGTLDTSFYGTGKVTTPVGAAADRGYSVAIQGDGRIVVTGESSNGSNNDFAVVRYLGDFPEIGVEQPSGAGLTDGTSSVGFGGVVVGGTTTRTFTVTNTGTVNLTGLGITFDGTNSGDFIVTTAPTAPVVPGGSTTFVVQFTPGGAGARSAALHIASNDADENPFDIALTGIGLVPEIAVEQPSGTDLADGGSTISFGPMAAGSSTAAKTFTIRNLGTSDLTGLAVSKNGTNFGDFAVNTTGMATTVAPSGSTTFTVTFTPAAAAVTGPRNATIHVASNDADENAFDIDLSGTGLSQTYDTDADGLNDAAEFLLATLGFDWQLGQTALVNTYYANANVANLYTQMQYDANLQPGINAVTASPNTYNLYTLSQIQALNVGVPLLVKGAGGQFKLTIGVEKSTDLIHFNPFPMTAPQTLINGQGKLEFQFAVPDNAAFFRLQSQ